MTHPFHPWKGRRVEWREIKHNWGEERVLFCDGAGRLRSIPRGWTSLAPVDIFVVQAAGRVVFRTRDLLELADLLHSLGEGS